MRDNLLLKKQSGRIAFFEEESYAILLPVTLLVMGCAFSYGLYLATIPFFIVHFVWFLRSEPEKCIVFVLAIQPFSAIYKYSAQFPSYAILFYAALILKVLFGSKSYSTKLIYMPAMAALSLLIAFQLLDVVACGSSLYKVVSFSLNMCLCAVVPSFLLNLGDERRSAAASSLALCFSLSVAAMIFVSDLFPEICSIAVDRESHFQSGGVIYDRFSGLTGDANYYSQLVLCAIAFSLGSMMVKPKKVNLAVNLLLVAYLSVQGARSYSKSYYLTLVVLAFAAFFILTKKLMAKRQRVILFFFLAPLAVVVVAVALLEIVMPGLSLRIASGQDWSTGRTAIWLEYLDCWTSDIGYLMFGVGFDNGRNVVVSGDAAHNIYVELLVELGVIGVACLVVVWSRSFKRFGGFSGDPRLLYILIIGVTGLGLALSDYDLVFLCLMAVPLFSKSAGQKRPG